MGSTGACAFPRGRSFHGGEALHRANVAFTAADRAARIAMSTPQRVAETIEGRPLSDSTTVEVVQQAGDLVSAAIFADVAAHVAYHFNRHPLVMAPAASSTRPLTDNVG